MKQKLNELKGDFNIPLSITGKTIRYKISKDTEELKNTVNLLDLIGIYRKFYPTYPMYTQHIHFLQVHTEHYL